MNSLSSSAEKLCALGIPSPRDYFHGIKSRNLCLADNVVLFLRTQRKDLQRRNFQSRPHHRFVLVLCYRTKGSINVDGRVFHLQPGTAFLVKPFQFHLYLEIEDEDIAWLFLTFETSKPKPFEAFANTPIPLNDELVDDALQIAERYVALDTSDEVSLDMLTFSSSSLLNKLRAYSLSRNRELIKAPSYPKSSYEIVDQINGLLEERLEDSISIVQISETLHLSESHLRKRFKSLTGLSLGSYLVHYKLNRAVKLLVHSDASLTQISLDCGYESLAAFSRSFKKQLGVSPSRYRRTATFGKAK